MEHTSQKGPHTARSPQDAREQHASHQRFACIPKPKVGPGEEGVERPLLAWLTFPLPEENKQQGARHGAEAEAVHGGGRGS